MVIKKPMTIMDPKEETTFLVLGVEREGNVLRLMCLDGIPMSFETDLDFAENNFVLIESELET